MTHHGFITVWLNDRWVREKVPQKICFCLMKMAFGDVRQTKFHGRQQMLYDCLFCRESVSGVVITAGRFCGLCFRCDVALPLVNDSDLGLI